MMLGAHHSAACFLLVLSCQCMLAIAAHSAHGALLFLTFSDDLYDIVMCTHFVARLVSFDLLFDDTARSSS